MFTAIAAFLVYLDKLDQEPFLGICLFDMFVSMMFILYMWS